MLSVVEPCVRCGGLNGLHREDCPVEETPRPRDLIVPEARPVNEQHPLVGKVVTLEWVDPDLSRVPELLELLYRVLEVWGPLLHLQELDENRQPLRLPTLWVPVSAVRYLKEVEP